VRHVGRGGKARHMGEVRPATLGKETADWVGLTLRGEVVASAGVA
jgi:hypothetical protein